MTGDTNLSQELREDLIRRAWYAHDARWYAIVAAEFGLEAANRLNRNAVRALSQVEAGRLLRTLGLEPEPTVEGVVALLRKGINVYVPPPLMEVALQPLDGESYQVEVRKCFAAANIVKAGIADAYECAVFDRFEGYHDAMGLPLAEGQLPASRCAMAEGRECRRVLRTGTEKGDSDGS